MTTKRILIGILTLLVIALAHVPVYTVSAQDSQVFIWVYDDNVVDSHFGYHDGQTTQLVDPLFKGVDVESLACLNNTIYAAGGGDGKQPSELYTLRVDIPNQATLTPISQIRTADQQPFFEVVALSVKADSSLWGYADWSPLGGIIRIDPTNGVAELIKASELHAEGMTWVGDVLWLAAGNKFYHWTPGGEITYAFTIAGNSPIEALETINDMLYAGVHEDDRGVIAVDPVTGTIIPGQGFPAPNDTEGITYCSLRPEETPTPTATATATPTHTATPTATATASATPTATATATATLITPGEEMTPTPTSTATPTATATIEGVKDEPTLTATPSPTPTGSVLGVDEPTALDETAEPAKPMLYLPVIVN